MTTQTFNSEWKPLIDNATSEPDFIETALKSLGDGDLEAGKQLAKKMPGFSQSMEEAMRRFDTSHWTPVRTFEEAKEMLHWELDQYPDGAILEGISLNVEYLDEATLEPVKLHITTDGCESVEAVVDEIEQASRPFDLVDAG